jgi:hypothetical protein
MEFGHRLRKSQIEISEKSDAKIPRSRRVLLRVCHRAFVRLDDKVKGALRRDDDWRLRGGDRAGGRGSCSATGKAVSGE